MLKKAAARKVDSGAGASDGMALAMERARGDFEALQPRLKDYHMELDKTSEGAEAPFRFFLIHRPQNGIWKGGEFRFFVSIGTGYPIDPPTVRFVGPNRIWHPNVEGEEKTGLAAKDGWGVCLDVTRTAWRPHLQLHQVAFGITVLFQTPNVDDALPGNCKEAAQQLKENRAAFEHKAQQWMKGKYIN